MKTSAVSWRDRRVLAPFGALVMACAQQPDIGAQPREAASAASGIAPAVASAPGSRRAAGANPFGLPSAPLAARPGDFALVPSRSSLRQAFEQPAGRQNLLYSGAFIERIGDEDSLVVSLTQQRWNVANVLVLPIRSERAALGDVVLTTFASGSALERAIVVSEGASESPRVRGLDQPLEVTALASAEELSLPKQRFHVLRTPGELGTTLACRRGERVERLLLTAISGERWLGQGFAGRTLVLDRGSCRAVPVAPRVAAGARVFVPVGGEFVAAEVLRVEPRVGRVIVKYEFAAEVREMAYGFGNVASELPP